MSYPVETKFYGKLVFSKVYSGAAVKDLNAKGGSIGMLENGVWVHHPSGHPLSLDEGRRILGEVHPSMVPVFEAWHERKERESIEQELVAVRPILVCPDDILRFEPEPGEEVGEEVTSAAAVFAYFPPDSVSLEVALRLFTRRQAEREKTTAAEVLSKDAGTSNMDQAFGRSRAGRGQPSTDPVYAEEVKVRRQEQMAKARAAKALKKAAEEQFKSKPEKVEA
jgi:hypothetical protein